MGYYGYIRSSEAFEGGCCDFSTAVLILITNTLYANSPHSKDCSQFCVLIRAYPYKQSVIPCLAASQDYSQHKTFCLSPTTPVQRLSNHFLAFAVFTTGGAVVLAGGVFSVEVVDAVVELVVASCGLH